MAAAAALASGNSTPSLRFAFALPNLAQRIVAGRRSSAAVSFHRAGAVLVFSAGSALAKVGEPGETAEHAEIRLIAQGDQAAFVRLADREAPRLLRYAKGIVGSLDEAEDIVQETLLALWEGADRWTPDARIGTWMHRVCYNRCIDRLRRRRPTVSDSVLEDMPDSAAPADRALVRSETARSVRDAIEVLPERQRSAVLLFHFQDLPQSEAAAVMGVSESAFESLLARARRRMRESLGDDGGDNA